jgi:two-component system sensor histidine kinase ChiS
MDSTVIGDVVNTAARLEELTKRYGCSILASKATIAKVRTLFDPQPRDALTHPALSFYSRWVDRVTPRGKQQALDLYEILGSSANLLEGEKLRSQSCYNSGVQALRQAEFSGALHHFQQVLAENPADATARFHAEQCQAQLGTISCRADTT